MNFRDLHEHLRLELLQRIERGTLNGALLARQTGFRQAHISNVLRRRRLLSLEGLDRILSAQNISLEQFLRVEGPADRRIRPRTGDTASIPIVSPEVALSHPNLSRSGVESLHVPATLLEHNRSRPAPARTHWQRYLALAVTADQAAPMHPLLSSGAMVVIDRHYTSLAGYHEPNPTLYAVHYGEQLLLRFVSLEDGHLILRPLSLTHPVRLIRVGPHDTPADYILGRACLLLGDL